MNEIYEVIRLTVYGDEEEDQELRENNEKYPELIRYIEDEEMMMVVNVANGEFVNADDFFSTTRVTRFKVIRN